jgi:Flp pilus assembly protein TadB
MLSLDGLLAALIAGGIGAAILLLLHAVRGNTPAGPHPPGRLAGLVAGWRTPAAGGRLALAAVVGVLTLVITGWPVAAVGVAALIVAWPALFGGHRAEQSRIIALEALVMWTESLRDTVSARASLEQAIPTTAAHAPAPIRPALIRLVGQLRARVPLDAALLALSSELNDASADKVIGALVLNTRQRGSGLATVLSALATSGRAELDLRRRISAGRASMRRSVQLVVAITVGFAGFLAVFSRDYVQPYRSVGGQVALAVVVGLFAASFLWLRRLAGGEPAAPFLNRPDARVAEADLRIVHHLTGLGTQAGHATGLPLLAGESLR